MNFTDFYSHYSKNVPDKDLVLFGARYSCLLLEKRMEEVETISEYFVPWLYAFLSVREQMMKFTLLFSFSAQGLVSRARRLWLPR